MRSNEEMGAGRTEGGWLAWPQYIGGGIGALGGMWNESKE